AHPDSWTKTQDENGATHTPHTSDISDQRTEEPSKTLSGSGQPAHCPATYTQPARLIAPPPAATAQQHHERRQCAHRHPGVSLPAHLFNFFTKTLAHLLQDVP